MPVLLGVLLVVAEVRPADPSARAQRGDRHVSVRHIAALKTLEHAIVRRNTVAAPLPSAQALLEGIPQCRTEWDGHSGILNQARQLIARSRVAALSPAQRLAAQLEELDAALLRFSTGANRRVTDAVGFDAARWFAALRVTLQVAVEAPEYPGHKFMVQCSDVASAVSMLVRADGRMLGALAWRGTVVDKAMVHWRPEQYVEISARQVARGNPWSGLPGCIYMGNSAPGADVAVPEYFVTGTRSAEARLCNEGAMLGIAGDREVERPVGVAGEATADIPVDDERWHVPPSLAVMLQPLATLQRPTGSLYRLYTDAQMTPGVTPTSYRYGPNRVDIGGAPMDVGFSIDLTIDPAVQALAQKTAACYTGRQDVCRSLGMQRKEDAAHLLGHRMLEHAMVRMAAVAVIDIASGRIEALAGALSPCTVQEYDGPGRAASCDKRLPYPIRYRPDALLNPAVYHDAMPASVIKPIMAAAFLSDPDVGARWLAAEQAAMRRPGTPALDSMRGQLMRSNSARFLDRMFCADQAFAHCRRPWEVQATALAFGWNGGCTDPRYDCGKRDLLFGREVDASDDSGVVAPLATLVPYGRLLAEPLGNKLGAPIRLRPATPLDPARVRLCAAGADGQRGSRDDWEKCRGGGVVDIVAEGWGQGHARSSALGVAGMMAALAAAANGQTDVRKPHLVNGLRGVGPADSARLEPAVMRWNLAQAEPGKIAHDAAEVILSGLSYGHRAGTSRLACEQVFDARTCHDMDWIAGKTGTPTFPNDGRSLDELARLCAGSVASKTHSDRSACGPLRPYKWYVAAYRTDRNDARWTKAIGVLTERNWIADTGRIHGAGDHGPNPAAEIAMQIAARHAGYLPGGDK
ncbi:MAG: hypothetical protein E6H78_09355 [Betaproteobacteria bacterium]|nr:MAG: hypothetical protein E6H78_09355 [Betaproteobacteria bacterium]